MRLVLRCPESKIAVIGLLALAAWLFVVLPIVYLPSKSISTAGTFWGLDGTAWTAIGALANVAYCALTAALLVFAIVQILSTREDAKITRTLAACERYDIDPIMDRVTRRLSWAYDNESLRTDPDKYTIDLNSLFNYFESMAIGVSRGHYDGDIVRDQLESIMIGHIEVMTNTDWGDATGRYDIEDFNNMMKLYRSWKEDQQSDENQ